MTLKEKVAEVEPSQVSDAYDGGVHFCPDYYDFLNANELHCDNNCDKCWNQEYIAEK